MYETMLFLMFVVGLIMFVVIGLYTIIMNIRWSWIERKEKKLEKKNLARYSWWLEKGENGINYDVVVYDNVLRRRV